MNGIPLTVFQIVQHRVITKLIAPFHKLFQAQSGILLRSQNSFRAKALRLLVNIMNHSTYRLLLRLCIIMNNRLPHNFLFRYARLVAILRKADKHGGRLFPRRQFSISRSALSRAVSKSMVKVCDVSKPGSSLSNGFFSANCRCRKVCSPAWRMAVPDRKVPHEDCIRDVHRASSGNFASVKALSR